MAGRFVRASKYREFARPNAVALSLSLSLSRYSQIGLG